jgi:hypothetical protein
MQAFAHLQQCGPQPHTATDEVEEHGKEDDASRKRNGHFKIAFWSIFSQLSGAYNDQQIRHGSSVCVNNENTLVTNI